MNGERYVIERTNGSIRLRDPVDYDVALRCVLSTRGVCPLERGPAPPPT